MSPGKLIICFLVLIVVINATTFSTEQKSSFKDWMITHNKQYASEVEFLLRLKNFIATEERLIGLHQEYPRATFGHNKFSDLTPEEFKNIYLLPESNGQCIWPFSEDTITSEDVVLSSTEAASSWDWRDQTPNPVTEVKDQGQCGSCWSFSTTGNIEGQWILAGNQAVTLSEQQLVDCSSSCLASEPNLCDSGCGGGLPWLAMNDIISWGSITTEAAYPYTAMDGQCQQPSTKGASISSWKNVESDQKTIQSFLQSQGPLSVTLNANPLMSYQSGVITGTQSSCPTQGSDHAVLLVGYGNDNGQDYFTVKNSWGTSWGEQGFFRMQPDICGLSDCVTSALV